MTVSNYPCDQPQTAAPSRLLTQYIGSHLWRRFALSAENAPWRH